MDKEKEAKEVELENGIYSINSFFNKKNLKKGTEKLKYLIISNK